MRLKSAAQLIVVALAAALCGSARAQSSTWKIDPAHSGVDFKIRHLGVANVNGSFSKVAGTVELDEKTITNSKVDAVIDATTINTNEAGRDKHLAGADFFDVAKYPTMTFKSTSVFKENGKLKMTGNLTLGGQTKPVTLELDGPAAAQKGMRGGMVSGFSATGHLSRKEFNFGQKYGEPVLGDDVKFTIDIEMSKP